jgi:hypothetical protein
MHVMEVGGDPKRFFLELASCFTPHVRVIRRLFAQWSRQGVVGQKARAGELTRQQFLRFCKEVGVCQGGGPMCKRSGAKLVTGNDVDRIFQRANIDSAVTQRKDQRPSMASALQLDSGKVGQLADAALDDLNEKGGVEADAGETELREKLRNLFDKYDEDGSGSVSTAEIGKMAASLKIELTGDQLDQLMFEADPECDERDYATS